MTNVATVRTGVFANLSNKIAKITGKFENVDEAKNQGVKSWLHNRSNSTATFGPTH